MNWTCVLDMWPHDNYATRSTGAEVAGVQKSRQNNGFNASYSTQYSFTMK